MPPKSRGKEKQMAVIPSQPPVPPKGVGSGVVISVHPVWPDIQFSQGELFFECTLFLYSVLALSLQYLNIYKTLWWLPKSYWHYSMKVHLINPYFLSCVGLLLGWRVTMCFWNTISEAVVSLSANRSNFVQSTLLIVEYAMIKTPLMTLVITSFLFSYTKIFREFSFMCMLYFHFPLIIFAFTFKREIWYWIKRFYLNSRKLASGEVDVQTFFDRIFAPMPWQLDLETITHMCSSNPVQVRVEVSLLQEDANLRMKRCLFSGISTAFYSILLPCIFVPKSTTQGMPTNILISYVFEAQLLIVVGLTAFALTFTYLLPLNYLDMLHRAAVHLGTWKEIPEPRMGHTGSMNQAPSPFHPYCLYLDGDTVQMPGGRCYKAVSSGKLKTVAAYPGDSVQANFFTACGKPNRLIYAICTCKFLLVFAEFWMLVLTNDWQHIVTFVLLMFANYILFAKLFKDLIILGRIYQPSQEDVLLIQQLRAGLISSDSF